MDFNNVEEFFEIIINKYDKFKNIYKSNSIENSNNNFVIWGAGAAGTLSYDKIKPKYYVDNNKELWGSNIKEAIIISPNELFNIYNNEKIVIASRYFYDEIEEILIQNGINKNNIKQIEDIKTKFNESYFEIVIENKSKIEKVYNGLEDKRSKDVLLNLIYAHINGYGHVDNSIVSKDNQYFDNDLIQYPGSYFVDVGSNDGTDSTLTYIEKYKYKYKKVYAFEPTEEAYLKLLENIENEDKNKIETYQIGLYDKKDILKFQSFTSSIINKLSSDGDITIQVNKLDTILKDKLVDFIKMDIEGSELKALDGSVETIIKNNPKLAICSYHDDFESGFPTHHWEVPLKILNIGVNYALYLRQHSNWLNETVCYAIPK